MSDFAAEAARAHAKAVSEEIGTQQNALKEEVDNVLQLVQGIMRINLIIKTQIYPGVMLS